MDFAQWLRQYTTLSESSIYKYSHAVNTISSMMIAENAIQKPYYKMSQLELDIAIAVTLANNAFIEKNATGNNMYSNALKQYRAFRNETQELFEQSEVSALIVAPDISVTERTELIRSRVGQGIFRKNVLQKYGNQCIITGIDNPRLLLASHIKPWATSSNQERLSVENGLCLSPSYDKLFDIGLITFSKEGRLALSSQLTPMNAQRLHISNGTYYNLRPSSDLQTFMEYHRDVIFIK